MLVVVLGKERRMLGGELSPRVGEGEGLGEGKVLVVGEATD